VTGSRVRLEAAGTLEPTTSIAQAYLDERGHTNLADALNSIPGYRGAVTPDGVQNSFGQGVNFINAYKLGSSRTLTLIDGRRAVSSNVPTIFGNAAPGTQVDLNIIPAILVDRVERVGIGGAPAYGSDAIAGTVNIRLQRDFTGLELRGTAGLSDRGDNFRHNLAVLYGGTFNDGRGHLTLALSHDRVDGVKQNRRGFYRANIGEVPNLDAAGLTPDGDGRLNLAVTNLFNRQGQDYFGYLIPASINDALGRRFTLSLTRRL
jgi:outer membrane receptor protein involved in Fe transport